MVKSSKLIHLLAVGGLMLGSLGMAVGGPIGMNLPQAETSSAVKAATLLQSELTSSTPLSLTIHKYASNDSDGAVGSGAAAADGTGGATITSSHTGLNNIKFTVQKIVPKEGKTASDIKVGDTTTYDPEGTAKSGTTATVNGQAGEATISLGTYGSTTAGEGKGIYLVHEVKSAGVTAVSPDFLVQLPLTTSGGDKYITDVNVYPKNKTDEIIMNPDKHVLDSTPDVKNDPDAKEASVELGGTVTWKFDMDVPAAAFNAGDDAESDSDDTYADSVSILDPVDTAHLTADYENVTGVYGPDAATATTPLDSTDFSVMAVPIGEDGIALNKEGYTTYLIGLTQAGMKKTAGQHVTFSMKTTVNSFADSNKDGIADPIYNTFDTVFAPRTGATRTHETTVVGVTPSGDTTTDPVNDETAKSTDTPKVSLGRIDITKVAESDGKTLSGAEFKIAATEADAKAGTFLKAPANMPGQTEGSDIVLTTGEDGTANVNGLEIGKDYFLIETKAPKGYELSDTVYKVTAAANTTNDATAKDQKDIVSDFLPITGGQLRIILMVVGTLLIIGSGTALYIKKRKENANLTD